MSQRIEVTVSGSGQEIELDISRGGQAFELGVERRGAGGNYDALANKPSIEGVILQDDKTFQQLGLTIASQHDIDRAIIIG